MDGLYFSMVTVILLGHVCTDHADVNCYHDSGAQELQRKCFLEQGIEVTLPAYLVGDNTLDKKKNYVDAVIAHKPDELCTKQEQFKLALKCAMTQTINCMPMDYHGYLPQPDKMAEIVTVLCDNKTKINSDCVKEKASELFDCGSKKGKEAFGGGKVPVTVENILCMAFRFNAECQRTELRSCGCSTVRAFERISRNLLYPPSCPRPILRQPQIECNPSDANLFVDNGGCRITRPLLTGVLYTFACSIVVYMHYL